MLRKLFLGEDYPFSYDRSITPVNIHTVILYFIVLFSQEQYIRYI